MTVDKIIEALRCTSAPGGPIEDCGKCSFLKTKKLTTEQAKQLETDNWTSCDIDRVGMEAADRLANDQIYIAALQKEIEKLRGQNRQLMLDRNYVMSIIADVTKAGKTWMCQYCTHCKGIVSGMADCDSKKPCIMPYGQFKLKRPEPPEVENAKTK